MTKDYSFENFFSSRLGILCASFVSVSRLLLLQKQIINVPNIKMHITTITTM